MEDSRCALFRIYEGGILVFDSKSRHPSQTLCNTKLLKNAISAETLKELEKCDPYGNFYTDRYQFTNMYIYPPYKYIQHEYTLVSPETDTLIFESRFESGNLSKAVKINDDEYDLFLEYDIETKGYTQWYFFLVNNYKADHTVKFNIVNMLKPKSLYSQGLHPWVLTSTSQWHQGGFNVLYYQNSTQRKYSTPNSPKFYYTLTFTYTFTHSDDSVYFSHCFPYTYTDLTDYLNTLSISPNYQTYLQVSTLCQTLSQNNCPILTITENIESYQEYLKGGNSEHKHKKAVIFTSRVHPGESNSSYVIKGTIDFLLSNSHSARSLRHKFVFKIVPMLNPDGVIYGNYRCSLLGVDLNRKWKDPNILLHPTIFYTKMMISDLKTYHQIFFFCDIHGHSTKEDSFFYGCRTKGSNLSEQKENIYIRLFPLMLARKCGLINYKYCSFNLEKAKESTARIVVFKEFGVLASYTLENSFLGCFTRNSTIFDMKSLMALGEEVCKIFSIFRTPLKLVQGVEKIYKGLISITGIKNNFDISQAIKGINEECLDFIFEKDGNTNSDSDSADSEDDDKKIEFKMMYPKIRTRKLVKKVRPPMVKPFSRTQATCAPSSLARNATANRIILLNSTSGFRSRKCSFGQIKSIGKVKAKGVNEDIIFE